MSLEYGLAVAFAVHACIDFLIVRSWFPQEGSSDLQLAPSDFGLQTFHHFLITSQLKINSFLLLECGHILLEMESILTDNFKVKASRGDRTHDPYWCETFKNLLHIALTRRISLWEMVHVKLQLYDEWVFARCYSSFVAGKKRLGSVNIQCKKKFNSLCNRKFVFSSVYSCSRRCHFSCFRSKSNHSPQLLSVYATPYGCDLRDLRTHCSSINSLHF